jgi:acyl CoA:acetate/3-ketoacid CoA transferase alpha subunit
MLEPPVVPLPDLAARVPDGASITLHKGDEPDVPMRLGMALIRRGVRGLHIVTLPTAAYPASGMLVDLLIGAGCVVSGGNIGHLAARTGCRAALHAGGEGRHG